MRIYVLTMAATPVKTWKPTADDLRVLAALKRAKVGENVSDRIRLGLHALARERLGDEGMRKYGI